jgi:hypothetical protein
VFPSISFFLHSVSTSAIAPCKGLRLAILIWI